MDQGVDFDSKKAPGQLRLRLLEENPKWKLPERRVARYLKKHLKDRQGKQYDKDQRGANEEERERILYLALLIILFLLCRFVVRNF